MSDRPPTEESATSPSKRPNWYSLIREPVEDIGMKRKRDAFAVDGLGFFASPGEEEQIAKPPEAVALKVIPTVEEVASACATHGFDGQCDATGNCPPEREPRYCDACPEGRKGLMRLYGPLPRITYQPGWAFRWSCANGYLFLHAIFGAPHAKGISSVTGEPRWPSDLMFNEESGLTYPFDPKWLLNKIKEIEAHERKEWLKVDGFTPFWPHAKKR